MNNTFYETYADNYKTKGYFDRYEALTHWIDCYKRDIKNEYDNTHSAKMLACIISAEYEITDFSEILRHLYKKDFI